MFLLDRLPLAADAATLMPRSSLPPAPAFPIDLRGLLEYVAERLELDGPGTHRLECEFRDGYLCKVYRT